MGFYKFIQRVNRGLGVGVADQAYIPTTGLPINDGTGLNRNVQRSFALTRNAFVNDVQNVLPVSILGTTGIYPHGVPVFTRLADNKADK